MLRLVLLSILLTLAARAFWRILAGIMEGMSGRPPRGTSVPARGVPMVRDPVCGTYVLPDRAVTTGHGAARVFFCSTACRDQYKPAPSPLRHAQDRPERRRGTA
jgi:hypothetical protein